MNKFETMKEIMSGLKVIYGSDPEGVNYMACFYVDWVNNFTTIKRFSEYLMSHSVFDEFNNNFSFAGRFQSMVEDLLGCFHTMALIHPHDTFEQIGLRMLGGIENND